MTVRVTTLKGAGSGRYYTEHLPSYYLDGDEPPGGWWGRGARHLGLDGQIDDEAFLVVMAGQDPETGKDLGRRYGESSVRGFDATFSAPKSVSVLFGTINGFSGNDFAAGLSPTALLARDLTGDGIVDILVASLVSGDFRVLVGDGQGGFPLLPSFPGTLGASDAVLQDMDGDGLPELVVSSLVTDRVSLVRNISQQ